MFDLIPFRKKAEVPGVLKSFHDWFDHGFPPAATFGQTGRFRTDIRETDKAFLIEADLPGFGKDDVEIEYNGGYLTIRAVRNEQQQLKDSNDKIIRMERYHGSFVRRFYVDDIEEDKMKATLRDGVLRLEVPKSERARASVKKIKVE